MSAGICLECGRRTDRIDDHGDCPWCLHAGSVVPSSPRRELETPVPPRKLYARTLFRMHRQPFGITVRGWPLFVLTGVVMLGYAVCFALLGGGPW